MSVVTALLLATVQAQSPSTAFTGATIIDATGKAPIANGVVVISNGRLQCVGTRAECAIPRNARVRNLAGKWIMPGIVDAHVHYSQTGWADGRPDSYNAMQRFPYIETIAKLKDPTPFYRSYLCSGVTATFDVGGFPWTWTLRAAAENNAHAPHVSAAGPLLSTRDHWLNVPGERQFLFIGSDSATNAGARYLIANRTDAIKVWFLAGANAADVDAMRARLAMIGEQAKAAGLPLIVHSQALWQAKAAMRAGAKLLVHGVTDQPIDDEFIALAKQAGTVYTPTLVVNEGYAQLRARKFDAARYDLRCVDPATRAKAFLTDSLPGRPDEQAVQRAAEAAARRTQLEYANVRAAQQAGIPVAMGTDAGNPLTLHGPSVYLEMEALRAAGLTPMQVIIASTYNSALAMGRSADFGTLERGKLADLVILDADPLSDIRNVRRVSAVVRAGTWFDRKDLEWR